MSGSIPARIRLWGRLARKFLRAPAVRKPAATVVIVSAVLTLIFTVLSQLSLTGTQLVERDLGRFEASVELGDAIGSKGGAADFTRAERTLAEAGARDHLLVLYTGDIRPATVDPPAVAYLEADWASQPFPGRYQLVGGRWPSRPGEVVSTASLDPYLVGGSRLSVVTGREILTSVGRVVDRYGTRSKVLLAGPGTWNRFDKVALAEKYPRLGVGVTAYWSGASGAAVTAALVKSMASPIGPMTADALSSELPRTLTTADAVRRSARGFVERLPLAYLIPSLALPALAVAAAFGVNGRRLRRRSGTLRAVGVRSLDAAFGLGLACSTWLVVGAIVGIALGAAAGWLARPIAAAMTDRPLAGYPPVWSPSFRLLTGVTLSCVIATVLLIVGTRRVSARPLAWLTAVPRIGGPVRQALAVGVAALAIWLVGSAQRNQVAGVLTGGLSGVTILLLPGILPALLRRLPSTGPRRRLAVRQLQLDPMRLTVAVALVLAATAPALTTATTVASNLASDALTLISITPPGQLVVTTNDAVTSPPPALVRLVVDAARPAAREIQLYSLGSRSLTVTVRPEGFGPLMAVDTVEEAIRLSHGGLSREQQQDLAAGRILLWGSPGRQTRPLYLTDPAGAVTPTPALPVTTGTFNVNWRQSEDGLMLTATAARFALPVSRGSIVLTGLSTAQIEKVKDVTVAAGYTPAFLRTFKVPDPFPISPAVWAALGGLSLLVFLALFTMTRAQAVALRGYNSGLIALGVPGRWARGVLILQTLFVTMLGLVLALAIACVSVGFMTLRVPGMILAVPWVQLGVALAGVVVAAIAATAAAGRRLVATDRAG